MSAWNQGGPVQSGQVRGGEFEAPVMSNVTIDQSQVFFHRGMLPVSGRILFCRDAAIRNALPSNTTISTLKTLQNKTDLLQCVSSNAAIELDNVKATKFTTYKSAFNLCATSGLTRGQRMSMDRSIHGMMWEYDDLPEAQNPGPELPAFIHHVYFPAITYNARIKNWVGAGFALFYSSEAPSSAALGHDPDFAPVKIDALGISVNIDFRLIGRNLHSVASITTALATTRPLHGSFIYVVDCNTDVRGVDPVEVRGASLGLAVAMAVMHGPQVAYTGFIRKFPGAAKFTGVAEGARTLGLTNTLGPAAANTDDIVEEVAGIQFKMGWAMQHQIPLVVPHKSSFGTDLMSNLNRADGRQLLIGMAQLSYSSTQADMGIPYASLKSPMLLATTVPEALVLGSYAYIAFYLSPIRADPRVTYEFNQALIDTGFVREKTRIDDATKRQRDNMVKYATDPVKYVDESNEARIAKVDRTTSELAKKRDAVKKKALDRGVARKVKAENKASGGRRKTSDLRKNVSALVGRDLAPKSGLARKKRPNEGGDRAVSPPPPVRGQSEAQPATTPIPSMQVDDEPVPPPPVGDPPSKRTKPSKRPNEDPADDVPAGPFYAAKKVVDDIDVAVAYAKTMNMPPNPTQTKLIKTLRNTLLDWGLGKGGDLADLREELAQTGNKNTLRAVVKMTPDEVIEELQRLREIPH